MGAVLVRLGRHLPGGASVHISVVEALNEVRESVAVQVFPGGTLNLRLSDVSDGVEQTRHFTNLGLVHGVVHAAYACNPVSSRAEVRDGLTFRDASIGYLIECVLWAESLGFRQLVFHPGGDCPDDEFQRRLANAICQVIDATPTSDVDILVEHMASGLGSRWHWLRTVVGMVNSPRVGICLDTTHAWASGLDAEAIAWHIEDESVVRLVHLNPPRGGGHCKLGSKRDRHGSVFNTAWSSDDFARVFEAVHHRGLPCITEAKRPQETLSALLEMRDSLARGTGVSPEAQAEAV